MKKNISIIYTALLLSMAQGHASEFTGSHWGGGIGLSNYVPGKRTGFVDLQGGYNWDMGSMVAGVGAYLDWDRRSTQAPGIVYGSYALGVDTKLGLAAGNWLPYAKLGYGYGAGTATYSVVSAFSLNAALGLEYKFSPNLGAFAEYKRYSYGNPSGSITTRKYMVGMSYWFGRPATARPVTAVEAPATRVAAASKSETAPVVPPPQPAAIPESSVTNTEPAPAVRPAESAVIEPVPAPAVEPKVPEPLSESAPAAAPEVIPPAPAPALVPAPVPEAAPAPEAAPIPEAAPAPETAAVPAIKPPPARVEERMIRIAGANFDTSSAKLKSAAYKQLDEVVERANQQPDAKLQIAGYTDSRDVKKLNKQLSAARAESVKEYLVNKGISAERITTSGEAAANPIGDNNTEAGRALNRRVEIIFVINRAD
ncbi:MAG: OmpA family protein [Pseudomonadota bacterium]